ncbi:MAG: DsbA family protein [Gemmatimonadales bacterium]
MATLLVIAVVLTRFRRPIDRPVATDRSTQLIDSDLAARIGLWRRGELDPERFYTTSLHGERVGPPEADVVLVVFSEYACGHCIAFEPTLEHLRARFPDHVAVVYRHFLPMMERGTLRIHLAAECAADQGRFAEYNHAVFAHASLMSTRNGWLRLGDSAGIPDMARFVGCTRAETDRARIDHDNQVATSIGVIGTPTTFINGLRVVGEVPFAMLDSMVAYQLDRLRPRSAN